MVVKKYRFLCFLLILFINSGKVSAQFSSNRNKTFSIQDTIQLDTLSIIPGSLKLSAGELILKEDAYQIDYSMGILILQTNKLKEQFPEINQLNAEFRVFPFNFSKPVRDEQKFALLKNNKELYDQERPVILYDLNRIIQPVNDFKFEGLTKSGSLTRGVSLGSSQDATVISAFNLQLSGKLNNDVEILASITDENIPVQPDGNTQTLQDFDRIFIQLSKGSTKVIGGDFFITKPKGYFLNVNKRAQGLSVSTAFPNRIMFKNDSLEGSMRIGVSGAVARGKFKRQEFNGIEGNQGPYRLTGNEGESFIIVLSGSETIFIDGRKMERGQENDYIIDYNTAEITFTANQIITKDKRIIVEFEYSDRNYQRWMVHTNNEWEYKNFSYHLNFFMELDDKNAPLNQTLTDQEKTILALAGDSVNNAVAPAIDSVGFNTNEILYARIDTLVNAQIDTIYIYSVHPDSAFFRVRFTEVGQGNGDYILINTLANGKVYKWVSPNPDGTRNGNYEPVSKLITPKSYRMVTLGTEYKINRNFKLDAEGALSFYDLNTFSSLNNADDIGYAFRINGYYESRIKKKTNDTLLLQTHIGYEQVSEFFRPVIRFRSVEFERDWNFRNRNNPNNNYESLITGTDYIPFLKIKLSQPSWGNISLSTQAYFKGEIYKAYRNEVDLNFQKKKWLVKFNGSQTSTQDSVYSTLFIRQKTFLKKIWKPVAIGITGESEINQFRIISNDSLQTNSYMFQDWEFYVSNGDSIRHNWKVFYKIRTDHLPDDNELKTAAIAHHAGLSFELVNIRNHFFKSTITYRNLQIIDTLLLNKQNESTLLTRLEYNGKILKGAITINVFYEVGSGLENRRDYQYVASLNGLGTHVWIDYNGNGVKERDEYEIRTGTIIGSDGLTYIKFFVPTNDYIKTYYNELSASINIKAPDHWRNQKGIKKFLTKISSQTIFRSDQKTQQDNLLNSFNPFAFATLDTALLSMNYSLRQTIYFNRFGSKIGLEINYQDIRNKVLLSNGIDTRTNQFGHIRGRWNIHKMLTMNLESKYGVKLSSSQFLRTRDYNITYWSIKPEFIIQPNSKYRITLEYSFSKKDNFALPGDTVNMGGQSALIHDAGIEFKTNFILKGQLSIKSNYIRIDYNDVNNTALSFEMLQGMNTGNNITWNVTFQRTLGNNLQLSLNYDGRYSEGSNVIHIGSVQLRAFF